MAREYRAKLSVTVDPNLYQTITRHAEKAKVSKSRIVEEAIRVWEKNRLALLLDAVPKGDGNPLDAAYLGDRIAMYEGRGQLFGTQFDWDANGVLSPAPIADPSTVDSRR